MGDRGPVPKRSDQRVRRNLESRPDKVKATGGRVKGPPASSSWHVAARRWYRSLGVSGQATYFEPSDWEHARLLAELLSDELSRIPRASMINAILAAMRGLGTTEADRRRMRIEVERGADPDAGDGEVSELDSYRRRVAGG